MKRVQFRDKEKFVSSRGIQGASQVPPVVKNPPANAGDERDTGSIPGLGRSLREGHGNLLHYSCLENPMDRRAWRAIVHRITRRQTQLKILSTHAEAFRTCSIWDYGQGNLV